MAVLNKLPKAARRFWAWKKGADHRRDQVTWMMATSRKLPDDTRVREEVTLQDVRAPWAARCARNSSGTVSFSRDGIERGSAFSVRRGNRALTLLASSWVNTRGAMKDGHVEQTSIVAQCRSLCAALWFALCTARREGAFASRDAGPVAC
ncbi:hypothetical protein CYMTET_21020 [Cymbomonas tetramitiformis]|uniref:Uncharacterized protein n=1 Tax=Cymbomonas tetramitiformis TaxID=36881 RepID=A0AAE0L3A4_9CHLO|nr:hypothetical protein CYMTET_21020 [Cymbomonas tetramitiformis]